MEAEPAEPLAAFAQEVVAELMASTELSEPDWDTFSLCAEVSEDSLGMTSYRYTEAGRPVTTEPAETLFDLIWDLWDALRGSAAPTWDILLLKLHRATSTLDVELVTGEAADTWRITPENMGFLPEALRPRPDLFESD